MHDPPASRDAETRAAKQIARPGPPEVASLASWARGWFDRLGVHGESPAYLEAVAAWRRAWRPDRVRVLLVAESHVAEVHGDRAVHVRRPRWLDQDLPEQFVRLVYCLGYGEPSLCTPAASGNGGTIQVWDLFGQVAHGVGHLQPRRSHAATDTRLRWKVSVLERLAERGIWLEDASPLALYAPGGGRLATGSSYTRLIREGYRHFVWPGVEPDPPDAVWVIGRGVGRALAGLPGIRAERIISQPQDRDRARFLADVQRLCGDVARIAPFGP